MKIVDRSLLNQGTEVILDTAALTIECIVAGNMTTYGVSLETLYMFTKDEWNIDPELSKFNFPFESYGEQYELIHGWTFKNQTTIDLIKDFGWAVKDANGVSLEEYMNITSLGSFEDFNVDQAYYLQDPFGIPVDIPVTGSVNQAVKIYGDAAHGNVDYRSFFQIFLREQGKTFSSVDLMISQNIGALTFKPYTVALTNKIDTNITDSDATILADAPFTGMSITYGATQREINGVMKDFGVVIDANFGTLQQVYAFVQYQLRSDQNINADDLGMPVRGDVAEELLVFVADTLKTQYTMYGGVYIDNFNITDINDIIFTDNFGSELVHPFIAAGSIKFNSVIQGDAVAKFWMYFTNDQAATTPTGKNFGTSNAILVNDNDGNPITGNVGGSAAYTFEYDYDFNEQRGVGSAGTPAPVTVIVNGGSGTKYTKAEGFIEKSVYNVFAMVGNVERNYVS